MYVSHNTPMKMNFNVVSRLLAKVSSTIIMPVWSREESSLAPITRCKGSYKP